MFLDEQLYEIGTKVDINNNDSIDTTIKEMFQACLDNSHLHLNPNNADDNDILPVFKRINASWNMAVKRLKKENKDFAIEDGFKKMMIRLSDLGHFKYMEQIIKQI